MRPDGSPSLNAQELDELRSNAFAANLKAGYCGDTPMEYLRERGYSIRYLYVSATKAVLAEHMFSPQSCAS